MAFLSYGEYAPSRAPRMLRRSKAPTYTLNWRLILALGLNAGVWIGAMRFFVG